MALFGCIVLGGVWVFRNFFIVLFFRWRVGKRILNREFGGLSTGFGNC